MLKRILQSNAGKVLLLIMLAFWLGSNAGQVRFDGIKLTQNPAIILKNDQDSITNRTAGLIEIHSMLKVKGLITDTAAIAGNQWIVSPSYTLNTYRKTSPTIQGAITNIDSGTIFVAPGVYNEKITLKSRVTLIGAGVDRTTITYANDSCVVYGATIANVLLKDLSIVATQTSKDTVTCIKLRRSFVDTTSRPTILFDNVSITNTYVSGAGLCTYGIMADSSSFIMKNSYMKVAGKSSTDDRACLRVQKSCKVTLLRNSMICYANAAADRMLFVVDLRCKFTLGYNQFMITSGAVFSDGVGANNIGRFYNNVSNVDITGGGMVNLISSPNNITDADILLQ